jgi:adenylate cyclase
MFTFAEQMVERPDGSNPCRHVERFPERRRLVDPKILEHRGRIVKNTGDGFLAEFPSAVDAVRCAVEVQRGMMDCEPEMPEERRIRLRIGINIGDVIVEDGDDIFGDGVKIAARMEGLAEPVGICVSGTVRDHLGDRLSCAFADLGDQTVKNIARPVRSYRIGVRAPVTAAAEQPAAAAALVEWRAALEHFVRDRLRAARQGLAIALHKGRPHW